MYWSVWCNERWVGLDARGPWGTYLDGYTASQLERYRSVCAYVPDHPSPRRTSPESARTCRCSLSSGVRIRRIRPPTSPGWVR